MHNQNTAKLHYGINQSNTHLQYQPIKYDLKLHPKQSRCQIDPKYELYRWQLSQKIQNENEKIKHNGHQKQTNRCNCHPIYRTHVPANQIGQELPLLTTPPPVLSHLLLSHFRDEYKSLNRLSTSKYDLVLRHWLHWNQRKHPKFQLQDRPPHGSVLLLNGS